MGKARFLILSVCFVGIANDVFAFGWPDVTWYSTEHGQMFLADALYNVKTKYNVVKVRSALKIKDWKTSYIVNFENRASNGRIENCEAIWEKVTSVQVDCIH